MKEVADILEGRRLEGRRLEGRRQEECFGD